MRAWQSGCLMWMAFAMPAIAAVPFDNGLVPVEVFSDFNDGGVPYRDLPADFPVPTLLPAGHGLRLVASVRRGMFHEVMLRSAAPLASVRAGLLQAYAAEGWIDLSVDYISPAPLSLCHDDKGYLDFSLAADDGGTRIRASSVGRAQLGQSLSCAQRRERREVQQKGSTAVAALVPAFRLPDGAVVVIGGPVLGIRGLGSSSTDDGTLFNREDERAFALAGASVGAVFTHYADQLRQAGWQVDSDSVGSRSAASVWFRTHSIAALTGSGTQQVDATATLEVVQTKADVYRYRFTLRALVGPVVP